MAILQVLGTDKALRINDFTLLNLVSSFDWAPTFNAQDIFEMGNSTKIDTAMELETSGSFEMNSVGNTAGLLARMRVTRDGSGNFTGWLYNSGGAGLKNGYTLIQDDLAEMRFDIIMHEKPDQKNFTRSLYLPQCFLTGISGRVDANGMASETYNWSGAFVAGFNTPFHDIRSVGATRTSNTTCTCLDTAVATATYTLAFVIIDGQVFTNITTDATYGTLGAAGLITLTTTEGYVIPTGAIIQACVYKTTPSTVFPTMTPTQRFVTTTNAPISYIKGYQANVYIAPATPGAPTAAEKWLRVQSMDWNIDLRVETLRQLSVNKQGSSIYARVPTFPISISANISVVETDWKDWQRILTAGSKTFAGSGNVHLNTTDFAPNNMPGEWAVVVEYYTKSGAKMQTWQFIDMRIDGYGTRQNVGGRGEISWTLRGTEFNLTGLNP
jgi:hypothetical protein